MHRSTARLLREAQELPEAERTELIEQLLLAWDGPADKGVDESWAREIDRRTKEIDAGTAKFVTWDEVKRRARARVRGNQ
jgi:putative addiction module component (TIGR02574 family)